VGELDVFMLQKTALRTKILSRKLNKKEKFILFFSIPFFFVHQQAFLTHVICKKASDKNESTQTILCIKLFFFLFCRLCFSLSYTNFYLVYLFTWYMFEHAKDMSNLIATKL
jgi:hypothetical protein